MKCCPMLHQNQEDTDISLTLDSGMTPSSSFDRTLLSILIIQRIPQLLSNLVLFVYNFCFLVSFIILKVLDHLRIESMLI